MFPKTNLLALLLCAASCLPVHPLLAQSAFADLPDLSRVPAVKDAGPRTYHFSIDYNNAGPTGAIVQRQRVTGDYTRGLANNQVEWHNVGIATVNSPTADFPAPDQRPFMEGFRYANDAGATMAPDFFKSFPPTAFMERNLVWDTGMFETFGQLFLDKLHLNQPFHTFSDQDVKMPGVGTFHNRDVVLEWTGRSIRNGQECAVIEYQAFFNPVQIDGAGLLMNARSDYWGTLWVSLSTRQVEYATLNEEVTGQLTLPGQTTSQPVNVLRVGTFEPIAAH